MRSIRGATLATCLAGKHYATSSTRLYYREHKYIGTSEDLLSRPIGAKQKLSAQEPVTPSCPPFVLEAHNLETFGILRELPGASGGAPQSSLAY